MPAVWKSAESSASLQQRRRGAIAASSSRRSSEKDTLERQQAPLVLDPERPVAADAVRRDDAVARDERRQPVARAERARRPCRARPACERGELAVRDDLAPRHGAQHALAVAVETLVELELDIREVVRRAAEERLEAVGQRVP